MLKFATGQNILSLPPLYYLASEESSAGKSRLDAIGITTTNYYCFCATSELDRSYISFAHRPRKPRVLNPVSGKSCRLSLHRSQISQDLVGSRSGAAAVSPLRFQIPLVKPDVRISQPAFGPRSFHALAHGSLRVARPS